MYALPFRITPDLISDYAAGRLDRKDAAIVEALMSRHKGVAAAVSEARQLNSRMGRYFAQRGQQRRDHDRGLSGRVCISQGAQ